MKYTEFKEEVLKRIKEYLPEEFAGHNISVEMVPKVNGFKEAIIINKTDCEDPTPNIYIDQLYDQYKLCNNMEKVLKFAAEFYMYGVNYGKAMAECMNIKGGEDKIIMMLVNTKNNKEMLKDVPNRRYMDLSIIYRIMQPLPDGSFNAATITKELARDMGKTEKELYELAMKNTERMLPVHVQPLGEGVSVISNDRGILGAAAIIYGKKLAEIADKMGSDLYIIPSSIHEVITVPVGEANADNLTGMIADANRTILKKNDVLSDTLYYYSREEGSVSMVKEEMLS